MNLINVPSSSESEQIAASDLTRADRRCGVDRLLQQQPRLMIRPAELGAMPEAEYVPKPLLMGRADRLPALGEELLPYYYVLQDPKAFPRSGEPVELLTAPRIGGAVIALYGSPVEAGIARATWFARRYPGLPVPELFYHETLRVREISQAEALEIRRREAIDRGEVLPVPLPQRKSRNSTVALVMMGVAVGLAWVVCHLPPFPAH